jgi:hypothetical protein
MKQNLKKQCLKRLTRKGGVTKAQVTKCVDHRRGKLLKQSHPVEPTKQEDVILPMQPSNYSDVVRAMYTPEQLEQLEHFQQADEADEDFMNLLLCN